jgi:thiol-disulfide isomerase/thioredoxin
MGKFIITISLALLVSCGQSPEPDEPASSAQQYRGRWIVLNYWAEWCKPCREEIPELNQLSRELADRVAVLGINYDGATGPELANAEGTLVHTLIGPQSYESLSQLVDLTENQESGD